MSRRKAASAPVLKFRIMVLIAAAIAALIAGPLLTVWKQVYINSTSLKLQAMSDTLTALNRQIASLKFQCERLSSSERIETIGRSLGLEYPSSNQIEIVQVNAGEHDGLSLPRQVIAAIKRSILRDRG